LADLELLAGCGGHLESDGGGEVMEGLWCLFADEGWIDVRTGECSCWVVQSRERVCI